MPHHQAFHESKKARHTARKEWRRKDNNEDIIELNNFILSQEKKMKMFWNGYKNIFICALNEPGDL